MKTPEGREVRFTKLSQLPHRWRLECEGKRLYLEKKSNGVTNLEDDNGRIGQYPSYEMARNDALKLLDKRNEN